MRVRFLGVVCVLVVFSSSAAGGFPVGWRADGTGRYADADPPTEWSADKNVVWKTPLASFGNATPVIVGERLFVCREIDTLVCLNLADGKVLWERANPREELLTDAEKAEVQEMAKEYDQVNEKLRPLQGELKKLDGRRKKLAAELKNTPEGLEIQKKRKTARDRIGAIDREKRKLQTESSGLGEELKKSPESKELKEKLDRIGEELQALEAEKQNLSKQSKQLAEDLKKSPDVPEVKEKMDALAPQIEEVKKQIAPLQKQLGGLTKYRRPNTSGANGYSTPTPASDGKYVYVLFGTGVAACYDLQGNRRWARFVAKTKVGDGHSASPLLVGDKLLVHVVDMVALNAADGEVLWRAKSKPSFGSPVPARIGGEDVAVTAGGDFIRVSDGTVLAARTANLTYNAPIADGGAVYFVQHGGKALKLPAAAAEKISPEVLWKTTPTNHRYYSSPLIHDGLIYAVTEQGELNAIDAATGQVVYVRALKLGGTVYSSVTLGGTYVFVGSESGVTVVVEPGREYKEVARNKLEPFRSCPVFHGSRMYVRTLKHVYCIGQ